MANSVELKAELRDLVDKMSAFNEKVETEKRGFSAEEREKWDAMVDEQTQLEERIGRAEKIEAYKKSEANIEQNFRAHDEQNTGNEKQEYNEVFERYLRGGMQDLTREQRQVLHKRSQVSGVDPQGGFAVNDLYGDEIIKVMQYENGFMNIGKIIRTQGGGALNFPLLDDTANIGTAIAEATDVGNDQFTLDSVVLNAHKYTSRMFKMSRELVEDNDYNLQSELTTILAQRIGRAVRNEMTSGGAGIATGITADATPSGVTVASNTISYDKLSDLIAALDPAYYPNAKFVFNHRTLNVIRKLVDTTGQPIWRPGMVQGEPDRIFGYEYELVSSMPDMDTLGSIPIMFGDFNYYYIRIARNMEIRRTDQRYIEFDQIGYVGFMRVDAKLVAPTAVQSLAVA